MLVQLKSTAAVAAILLTLLLLAGCKRGEPSPTPVSIEATSTASQTVTPEEVGETPSPSAEPTSEASPEPTEALAYPAATQQPTRTPLGGYLPPGEGSEPTPTGQSSGAATAYPAESGQNPTATQASEAYPPQVAPSATSSNGAYPPPENNPAVTPSATSLTSTVAAGSGTTSTPTGTSQTLVGGTTTPTAQPDSTPSLTPEGTPVPSQTPTITQSPTITMTPTKVRSELVASNPEDFHPVSGSVQLVTIYANWHPSSKSMAPVLLYFEGRFSEDVIFTYLDYDDLANGMYASLIGNRELPVIFLLGADGQVLDEWEGIVLQETLETAITAALSASATQ